MCDRSTRSTNSKANTTAVPKSTVSHAVQKSGPKTVTGEEWRTCTCQTKKHLSFFCLKSENNSKRPDNLDQIQNQISEWPNHPRTEQQTQQKTAWPTKCMPARIYDYVKQPKVYQVQLHQQILMIHLKRLFNCATRRTGLEAWTAR